MDPTLACVLVLACALLNRLAEMNSILFLGSSEDVNGDECRRSEDVALSNSEIAIANNDGVEWNFKR